jgi:acetyltransferase-like isoleucine patch superfamily enzyme
VSRGARVSIGEGTFLSYGSQIIARESVTIGKRCALSWNVTILDSALHGIEGTPASTPVVIEDDVLVGHGATILQGVRIGKGSIVAARAVVHHDVPPRTIVAGVPANRIREDARWTL